MYVDLAVASDASRFAVPAWERPGVRVWDTRSSAPAVDYAAPSPVRSLRFCGNDAVLVELHSGAVGGLLLTEG